MTYNKPWSPESPDELIWRYLPDRIEQVISSLTSHHFDSYTVEVVGIVSGYLNIHDGSYIRRLVHEL